MVGLSEYTLIGRGGAWPADEGLVLDPVRGDPVAVIRDEPWPEVLERPWPDGAKARPWLWRLLSVGRNPCRSRTVVRRLDDGSPLVRLHRREALFEYTVGIFDREDHRVGSCRWAFKGAAPRGEFPIFGADRQQVAQVCGAGPGAYRVAGASDGSVWATVRVSRSALDAKTSAACRVCVSGAAVHQEKGGVFLLAAALVLFQSEREVHPAHWLASPERRSPA